MSGRGAVVVWAVVCLAAASSGCSSTSTCSRAEETIDVYGFVNADRTVFSSVQPAGQAADGGPLSSAELQQLPPYTYFPANRIIRFHVGLADVPTDINVYLSFSPSRDATVAPAAGNQSLIRRSYSKDEIVIRNDTCSEFWVWLTASTSAQPFQQLTDGGADEGTAGASGSDSTDGAGAGAL